MKVLSSSDLVKTAAKRWKKQYYEKKTWYDGSYKEIYEKLLTAKTYSDVDKITGNDSWSTFDCYECGENKRKVLVIGKLHICLDCAKDGITLLKNK